MTFLRVVGKRLFWAAVLLVLVLCLNFFLIRLAPGDPAALGGMVQDICYNNAVRYFGLSV